MNKIVYKKCLNPYVTMMKIEAPLIARKCGAGEFIIVRPNKDSERIPLTIADYDKENGLITIIFQIVGHTTFELNQKEVGDYVESFVGPLGNKTDINNVKKAIVVGGGVGSAIAYPIAKALHEQKAEVKTICGFRNKDLVILEDEFKDVSDYKLMTDDGSKGEKGLVTMPLENLLMKEKYDLVIAIGPLIMMKFVTEVCKKYNQKVVVSMNPIMIDGTGMCGGCRLTVDGKMKFACIDGPDFDGTLIDFDEAIKRNNMFKDKERQAYDSDCNLMKEGVKNA